MLKIKVEPQWIVIARHFGMGGGIFGYGVADIKEFFDNFNDACNYAEQLLKDTHKDLIEPMIWVLRCERTYQRAKEGLCYAES